MFVFLYLVASVLFSILPDQNSLHLIASNSYHIDCECHKFCHKLSRDPNRFYNCLLLLFLLFAKVCVYVKRCIDACVS